MGISCGEVCVEAGKRLRQAGYGLRDDDGGSAEHEAILEALADVVMSPGPVGALAEAGAARQAEGLQALLATAPALAKRAAAKLGEVSQALSDEMSGLDCLTKYGEECNDAEPCAVCSHMAANNGAAAIIEELAALGAYAPAEDATEALTEAGAARRAEGQRIMEQGR